MPIQSAVTVMLKVIQRTVDVAIGMIEAALVGQVRFLRVAQVPLPSHPGFVTRRFEALRKEVFIKRHAVSFPGANDGVDNSEPHRGASSHQRRARWRADRHDVEAFQPQAFTGKLVDVGRVDFAAPVVDVGSAEVVGQQDDDVGFGRLRVGGGSGEWQSEEVAAAEWHWCILHDLVAGLTGGFGGVNKSGRNFV